MQRNAGEPADRREQHRVVEGPVAAVPLAVPQRQPAAREQLDAVGRGREVDALRAGEDREERQPGGEQRRDEARAGSQDHRDDVSSRRMRRLDQRIELGVRRAQVLRADVSMKASREECRAARAAPLTALDRDAQADHRRFRGATGRAGRRRAPSSARRPTSSSSPTPAALLAIFDAQARFRRRQPGLRARPRLPARGARSGSRCWTTCTRTTPPRRCARPPAPRGWQQGFVELLGRHRHRDGSWRWLLWSGSARDEQLVRLGQGRHGVDPPRAPGRPRPADDASQPRGLHRRADACARAPRTLAPPPRRPLHRHRLLQADQRQRRPRGGRPAARRGGAAPARRGARRRRRRPARGRRVRDPARAARERPRGGRRRAPRAAAPSPSPSTSASGPVEVSASVGLATAHDGEKTADRLIHEADIAMYRAKATGRNRFAIFDADLRVEVDRRLAVERDLRKALGAQRVRGPLPAGRLARRRLGGRLRGAAALDARRMGRDLAGRVHPARRGERPDRPDRRVGPRDARCASSRTWRAGGRDVGVSVNISPRQLADEARRARWSPRCSRETGVPPQRAVPRGHRDRGPRRADPRRDAPRRAARARRADRLRRLRHRLLLAAPPQPAARST